MTAEGIVGLIALLIGGIIGNAVLTLRNGQKQSEQAAITRQATITATNDQTAKIVDAFSAQQQTTRDLMQMVINSRDATITRLQSDMTVLLKDNGEFKALVKTYSETVETQAKEIKLLNASLAAVQEKQRLASAAYERELTLLRSEISAKDGEIERLNGELQAKTVELKDKLADMAKLQEQVTVLNNRVDELQRQLDDLRSSLAEKDKVIERLTAERDQLRAENADLKAEVIKLKGDTGKLNPAVVEAQSPQAVNEVQQ